MGIDVNRIVNHWSFNKGKQAMRIWIGKKEIENGTMSDSMSCAVAKKLQKLTGRRVVVGPLSVDIGNKNFKLEKSGIKFVRYFDANKNVTPQYITIRGLTQKDLK